MVTNIISGSHQVIASGLVTSYENNPIEITIYSDYKLKFTFIQNEKEAKQQLNIVQLINETGINFELTNFDNPLGTATIKPIVFALDNRAQKELSICFSVYVVGEASHTLQYTIYREI